MQTCTHRHNEKYTLKLILFSLLVIAVSGLFVGCTTTTEVPAAEITVSESSEYTGKKIVWVDSYHAGYEWSDGVEAGVQSGLENSGVDLKIMRMDTKRNSDEAFGQQAGLDIKTEIEAFNPDVVIACDDNAQKYLVVPFLKDTDLPVVFCGVNWDASPYGYPASNVTGMIEIDLATQTIDLLKPYANGDRIAYLTGESETERTIFETYNDRFFNDQLQEVFVTNFDDFKSEYLRLQDEVDIIYMGNNAGIIDWDDAAAEAFLLDNTKIPSGSINTWMAPYALLIVGKSAAEQGEWAAGAALSILDGTPIPDIPIVENKESTLILNLNLADKLDVVFTPSMLRYAEVYGE